jgi:hypothetical protein
MATEFGVGFGSPLPSEILHRILPAKLTSFQL